MASVTATVMSSFVDFALASRRFPALVNLIVTSLLPGPVIATVVGRATAVPFFVSVKMALQTSEQLSTTLTPDLSAPVTPSAPAAIALVAIGAGMIGASGGGGVSGAGQPSEVGCGSFGHLSKSSLTPSPSVSGTAMLTFCVWT